MKVAKYQPYIHVLPFQVVSVRIHSADASCPHSLHDEADLVQEMFLSENLRSIVTDGPWLFPEFQTQQVRNPTSIY
jgi:hypothetical protein